MKRTSIFVAALAALASSAPPCPTFAAQAPSRGSGRSEPWTGPAASR